MTAHIGSRLQRNLPPVPIHDLAVKDNDLVAATHGRSFWILTDVSPLRQMTAATTHDADAPLQARDGLSRELGQSGTWRERTASARHESAQRCGDLLHAAPIPRRPSPWSFSTRPGISCGG